LAPRAGLESGARNRGRPSRCTIRAAHGRSQASRSILEQRPNATFTLALTVLDRAGGKPQDVLIRGTAEQTVGNLAQHIALYLARPAIDPEGQSIALSLRVERTSEYLRPDALLHTVDLLDGDVVTLVAPGG
jgi:hypothetical protein